MKAEDFFKGLFETDLRPGELIVAVEVSGHADRNVDRLCRAGAPARRFRARWPRRSRHACERDRIGDARLAYFGCVDRAKLARSVSAAVEGLATPLPDAAPFEAGHPAGPVARGHTGPARRHQAAHGGCADAPRAQLTVREAAA